MKTLEKELAALQDTMQAHLEHIHQHPETAFEENETAAYIAGCLKKWGYTVSENIGKTGVVGQLKNGSGSLKIGLRADTDALPIDEITDLPYKSRVAGKSHTCGHDGHTAMLLGAAQYLAEHKNFNGTLNLIFQPAEEIMGGAQAMIEDGLLEKFPMDYIFGMHNMPGEYLPGHFYFTEGACMTAVDNWEIKLTGKGTHGSMPHLGRDPIVAGAALVNAFQSIISRNVPPLDTAVVTVGAFLAGEAGNAVADSAVLRLSVRSRTEAVRSLVIERLRQTTKAISEAYQVEYSIKESTPGAVLVNNAEETARCAQIARDTFGAERVITPGPAVMASEDFAFYLQKIPGCYVFLGGGAGANVHQPQYIFNKENLKTGAAYWVAVAQSYLK